MTIVIAVIVFGVLIFVHELGHFVTAKLSGIKVNEFALGMGPAIFSRTRGETKYSLRLFPIGGYCAMEGENDASEDSRAFCNTKLWKRVCVTVAGSLMNILLGLVLLGVLSSQMELIGTTVIAGFEEGALTSEKLRVGDEVLRMNGRRVRTYNDMTYEMIRDRDGVMDIEVRRPGTEGTLLLTDVRFQMQDVDGGGAIIYRDFIIYGVEPTAAGVARNTFNWTLSLVKQVWGSLVDLVTGRFGFNQLSGPVGVTTAIGEASSAGWDSLVMLVAFITVNLGVFNLLPLPALDGGRLLFLLFEGIRRKPVDQKYEGYIHAAGFALLIGLMIVVTFKDIVNLF